MERKIVICCDGTWSEPQDYTNIFRTYEVLRRQLRDVSVPERKHKGKIEGWQHCHGKASDGSDVLLYYDKGVGTRFGELLAGGAFGHGLSENVCDAYHFLAHHYQPEDKIYIFGFSRGAYTARSLCGFLDQAGGLLQQPSKADVLRAYLHYYVLEDAIVGRPQSWSLMRVFDSAKNWFGNLVGRDIKDYPRHTDVKLRFIGVYDTVGALGIPVPQAEQLNEKVVGFHNTNLGANVEHAVQALSVDEQRGPYAPTIWSQPPGGADLAPGQTCLQVWFPGVHSDIGGGYSDKSAKGIFDITFDFMLRRAAEHGLILDADNPLPQIDLEELPSQHDSMDGLWEKVGRFFESFTQERPIGAAARAQAGASTHLATGREMLHPCLVQRLGKQVTITKEKDGGQETRSVTYAPNNVPWSAVDIQQGRADLPLFRERAELRILINESGRLGDAPCVVVDRSIQGARIEISNPPVTGASVVLDGHPATVVWVEDNQAGLRLAA